MLSHTIAFTSAWQHANQAAETSHRFRNHAPSERAAYERRLRRPLPVQLPVPTVGRAT